MKAPKATLPILAAAFLALLPGAAALFAQDVALPPANPATEVEPLAEPVVEVDPVVEPGPKVQLPPGAPASEPAEVDPATPPAPDSPAVPAPAPGDDISSEKPAGAASPATGEDDEETPDLAPLPERAPNKEEDAFLPPSYSPQRYTPTWSDSAFTREIIPEAGPTVEVVNPYDKYVLTGIATIGGAYVVSSVNEKNEPVIIRTEPKEKSGLFVVSVDRAAKMADSSVTISDGKNTGTIKFDPKRMGAPPKAALAMGAPQGQGRQPVPGAIGAGAVGGTPQQQQQQLQLQQQQALAAQAQAQAQAQANQNLTPEQQQAEAAAAQQANEQLIQHLRSAAQAPPAGTPAPGAGDAESRRRRVVLPPSNKR